MALKSAKGIEYKNQVISIRIQELDPDSLSQRPYEEDLVDDGLCADSIGDIPLQGDYLSLEVTRYPLDKENDKRKPIKRVEIFKVLTRYFSFDAFLGGKYSIQCNIVVEPVTDSDIIGKLNKD